MPGCKETPKEAHAFPFAAPAARIREFTPSVRSQGKHYVCFPKEGQERMFLELMSAMYCEEESMLP